MLRFIAPLVTAFTDDTSQISEVRMARQVRWHAERGASAYMIGGETGEWHALSHAERKQVIEWVARDARTTPFFVHGTAMTTAAALDLCQHAEKCGAQAVLVGPPPGLQLGEDELRQFRTVLRRHVNTAIGWLEPLPADELPGMIQPLAGPGLDGVAVSRSATAEEALIDGMVLSPIGCFGADKARSLVNHWPRHKLRVQALIRHGRPHRAGKAIIESLGLDLGPPRPPILPLDPTGRGMVDAILSELH